MPALYALHRRFDAWAEPVRVAVIGVQLAVAVVAVWIVAPVVIAIATTCAAVVLFSFARGLRRPHAVVPRVVLDLGSSEVLQ